MAVLPTGFGKSFIYQIIPKVLECLKNESEDRNKFIVCFFGPLEYIICGLPSFLFLRFLKNIIRLLWIWCRSAWRTIFMTVLQIVNCSRF